MAELLWAEGEAHQETRYKVLFPITTPLMFQPPQVVDSEFYIDTQIIRRVARCFYTRICAPQKPYLRRGSSRCYLGLLPSMWL